MNTNILDVVLAPFCCNRNHFFVVRFGGRAHRFCTRSVPMLFGALSTVSVIAGPGLTDLNGPVMALIGVLLILSDLVYWALTRLGLVPDRVPTRVTTGFLLGFGVILFGQASIAISIKVVVSLAFFVLIIVADSRITSTPPGTRGRR